MDRCSVRIIRFLLLCGLMGAAWAAQAQTEQEILESKLNYCRYENEQLESKVGSLSHLNSLQMAEILRLKHQYNSLDREINALEVQVIRMKGAAGDLLSLATQLEKEKEPEAAIRVCRTIVKVYPGTLEAESAAERIAAYEQGGKRR